MSKRRTEVDCLERLNDRVNALDDIMSFLVEEGLMDLENIKTIKGSSTPAVLLHTYITAVHKDSEHRFSRNSLQLLEYEWHILPVERIKITMVTDRATRDFTYNF
jgi:hypothetical protein